MDILSTKGLADYLKENSGFNEQTINNIFEQQGFAHDNEQLNFEELQELSFKLSDCASYGANTGIFSAFIYYDDTTSFYKQNRNDIVNHLENMAEEFGEDVITMVKNFGSFRNDSDPPTSQEIGRALYDPNDDNTILHNVFAWYALEEVSRTWSDYLDQNPGYRHDLEEGDGIFLEAAKKQESFQYDNPELAHKAGYVQGVCECVAVVGEEKNLGKKLLTEMNVTKDMAKKYASPETYKTLEQGIFAQQQTLERTQGRSL